MSNNPNTFKVTMLGTASAMPVRDRNQSAQALQVHGRLFLVDCGEGTQYRMAQERIPMMKLDSVFISHIHGDHVFGIFGLLSTLGMKGRQTPLNIFAPNNFGPILKFFLSYYGDGIPFEIRFTPLKMKAPETVLQTKATEVLAFPLNHGIDTFGFLFREKEPMFNVRKECIEQYGLTLTEIGTLKRGEDVVRADGQVIPAAVAAYKPYQPRSYAYCSDTAPFPEEAVWLKGTTVIYHEATYPEEFASEGAKRGHSTTLQAAALAKEAGAGRLIIGHYTSRNVAREVFLNECRSVFPETFAASDGDVYDI
ncbi:MAG: ribonuclease Z [Bacteroidales bacterium]|nr:ribonuclease Z [Bacteroidales bacterium]